MPNLHIIIGDPNTRKSSSLRCLIGMARYGDYDVAQASGPPIRVYCQLKALQEEPILPADFIANIHNRQPKPPLDIAISLRVTAVGNYPGFDVYLKAFSGAGWLLVNVALLGPAACGQQTSITASYPGTRICAIPLSPTQPTNQTAGGVRNTWLWA